jgi:hypothetical protein
MAKCMNCGGAIEGNEITYRPSTKGGRRVQSIRLCYRCVDQHDRIQAALKIRNMGILVLAVAALVIAAFYLIARR